MYSLRILNVQKELYLTILPDNENISKNVPSADSVTVPSALITHYAS